jgi:hypothetical protein
MEEAESELRSDWQAEACPTEGGKKRRTLGGKRPPVWSAKIQISPPDQVVKTSYTLYDVGWSGKVAKRAG